MPVVKCNNCNITFKARNKGCKHYFCDRHCYNEYRKSNNITGSTKKETVQCKGCNKEIMTTQHKIYCSDKCFRSSQKRSICGYCGIEFSRIYDHHNSIVSEDDLGLVMFCCNHCKDSYHGNREIERRENISKTITGVKHWTNPSNYRADRILSQYKRNKIRKRDKNTCQMCGVTHKETKRNMDTHHIIAIKNAININTIHDDWNLISLCSSCHSRAEVWA